MTQYIDKSALVAEIKRYKHKVDERLKIKGRTLAEDCKDSALQNLCGNLLHFIDTLEVKEVETPVIPKHSYFEEIYHCGSEPRWKIGDVLAVYEFYSDYEGEYIYGKITDVKMDETEDWCYTFENGDMVYENRLISDETYKKN